MEKISIEARNGFCPQAVFMYGTNKKDGSPNFGTFTWFSYCWDLKMGVMASIGGGKETHDRIKKEKIFSANLVTEPLLPLADYLGNHPGRSSNKMEAPMAIARGAVLDVPVLADSPWVYELEVKKTIPLMGNTVFLCKIRNTLVDQRLMDESIPVEERVKLAAPVVWLATDNGPYFPVEPKVLGNAGDWKDLHS
ncbi:MAG: flavin reductase family protein [Oscillospiraceae bacterium]|nr:flavin reductase family protein [Oscillospiraceae bacterium]